jgi:hypothetical protein
MCVLVSSTTSSETFLILIRNERGMITDVYGTLCKVTVILVAQLVEALRYKPEGRGFDSQFRPTVVLVSTQSVREMSTRSISWGVTAAGD